MKIQSCIGKILFPLMLALSIQCSSASILIHGDSLSAGFGLQTGEEWPALLAQKLIDEQYDHYQVVNTSISGETTQGGLARIDDILNKHKPEIVILELGANDGLRGQSTKAMYQNLSQMIMKAQKINAQIVLTGIYIPPNYGKRYTEAFKQVYVQLDQDFNIAFIPFLFDGLDLNSDLQSDGIHPTAQAQPKMLENVWKTLKPLLHLKP